MWGHPCSIIQNSPAEPSFIREELHEVTVYTFTAVASIVDVEGSTNGELFWLRRQQCKYFSLPFEIDQWGPSITIQAQTSRFKL
jgi:hypothetical protein